MAADLLYKSVPGLCLIISRAARSLPNPALNNIPSLCVHYDLYGFTHASKLGYLTAFYAAHLNESQLSENSFIFRFSRTWSTAQTFPTQPSLSIFTGNGLTGSWRSSSGREIVNVTRGWRSRPCATDSTPPSRSHK